MKPLEEAIGSHYLEEEALDRGPKFAVRCVESTFQQIAMLVF
jgi:hypothetical protein